MKKAIHEAALLAEKIKGFEQMFSLILPACKPYIVRLDGVSFKRYTAGMAKPMDPRFTKAMLMTSQDLLEKSSALTAFCQSDEITLVFAGEESEVSMYYGGRVNKIQSVLASIASTRFNHHISRIPDEEWAKDPQVKDPKVIHQVKEGNAFFDARAFSVPNDLAAMEAVYWRHKFDLRRNMINSVGFHYLGHRQTENLPVTEVLKMLREKLGIANLSDMFPKEEIFGTFLKKIQYTGTGFNPKLNQHVECIRTRIEGRSFDWEGTEEERVSMIMSKYWT